MKEIIAEFIFEHFALFSGAMAVLFTVVALMELYTYLGEKDDVREKIKRCEERYAEVIDPALSPDIPLSDVLKSAAGLAGDIAGIPIPDISDEEGTVRTLVEYTYDLKKYRSILLRKLNIGEKWVYKAGDEIVVYIDPEHPEVPLSADRIKTLSKGSLRGSIIFGAAALCFWAGLLFAV